MHPRIHATLVSGPQVFFTDRRFFQFRFCYRPTQTPTQKFKNGFLRLSAQEIGSSLVSLEIIFEPLRIELFRFEFHSLSSKILKIPGKSCDARWFDFLRFCVKNFEMNRVIFGTIVKRVLWLVNDIISRLVPLIRWMGIILQLLNVVIGHSPSISIT